MHKKPFRPSLERCQRKRRERERERKVRGRERGKERGREGEGEGEEGEMWWRELEKKQVSFLQCIVFIGIIIFHCNTGGEEK